MVQVRVVEFNTSTSFHEQLQVISGTGVFISVHTSNLANAQFLPPGAAVFEIIQRNWVWENLDRSFQVAQNPTSLQQSCQHASTQSDVHMIVSHSNELLPFLWLNTHAE